MVRLWSYLCLIQQVSAARVQADDWFATYNSTVGQEEFDRLRSLSYADTHVVMMCYAVDSLDSLENIPNRWLEEVSEHCPYAKLILVALKCDLRDNEQRIKKMKGRPVMYEEVSTLNSTARQPETSYLD